MKKVILLLIVIIIFLITLYFLFGGSVFSSENDSLSHYVESLKIQSEQHSKGKVVIVYFNSECHLCEEELENLEAIKHQFTNIDMLFVSSEETSSALNFLGKYGFSDSYQNTTAEDIMNTFEGGIPQILIFENDEKTDHFFGVLDKNKLLKELK